MSGLDSQCLHTAKVEATGVHFEYEPRLPYTDDQGRTRFIHPDFYLIRAWAVRGVLGAR